MDIGEDEHRTRDLSLERAEQPMGSLLVTSDAGGDVYVDGTKRDTAPAIVNGLPAGDHIVEVRVVGSQPWRQSVTVVPGQQTKVAATLAQTASVGSLRVIASDTDVDVFVDGEAKGKAPVDIRELRAGQHIVEGRKAQFRASEQTIQLAGGEQTLIRLKMEPLADDRPRGILKIQSLVPDAEVFLDGSSLGRAPVERRDLEPGKHYITVRKDGYAEYKREIMLVENVPLAFAADLRAIAGLRFLSTPRGATVSVDGEPIGATPASGPTSPPASTSSSSSSRATSTRARPSRSRAARSASSRPTSRRCRTGRRRSRSRARGRRCRRGAPTRCRTGAFVADFGLGYPYFFFARLTVGAFALKPAGLDLGVEFQSFVQMNTLALHGRMQLAAAGPLAVAVRGDFGGGAGSNGTNTAFFDLAGVASLAFADVAVFSLDLRLSGWTDQFCPSVGPGGERGVAERLLQVRRT